MGKKTRTYTSAAIKILFAQSGNKCAYPSCPTPVIFQSSEGSEPHVTGQICHIFPASSSGPRAGSGLARTGINNHSNLIILCPTHHDIVDRATDIFTEEVLKSWKDSQRASTLRHAESSQNIDISRLPSTGGDLLGRTPEVARLDEAWRDRKFRILSIVALGGVGKSALVNHWLANMPGREYGGARVYAWSFYAQGTNHELASSSEFLEQALTWFGDQKPLDGDERDKGRRLAELVRAQPTILILDGLEPLQQPPGHDGGKIVDPAIETLLTSLASSNLGLCIITTRYRIPNLERFRPSVDVMEIKGLQEEDGIELLAALGVRGDQESVACAVREYDGHPLALHLLGTFLQEVHGGDVERRADIPLREWDSEQGGKARRIMQSYKSWLGEGPALQILRILGLFDRPADAAALSALRQAPSIVGLTDQIVGEVKWAAQLSRLRTAGLIARETSERTGELDTHPLIRDFFGSDLQNSDQAAWLEGNRRLYEYLKRSAPEQPDTLSNLFPLFSAISHGCKAGFHSEVLQDIYIERIQRGRSAWYSTKRFGIPTQHLAALSQFVDTEDGTVRPELANADKIYVLMERAYQLRALGRLRESIDPLMAAREECIRSKLVREATSACDCLAETHLYLGEIALARSFAEETVHNAQIGQRKFQIMYAHCTLANVQHFAGQFEEAAYNFHVAETIQAERQPNSPRLKSLNGVQYCDFLISTGQSRAATERGREILDQLGKTEDTIVARAIGSVVLARALMTDGVEAIDEAVELLQRACSVLRATGQTQEYAIALISWAALLNKNSFHLRDDFRKALIDAEEVVRRLGSDILRIELFHAKRRFFLESGDINSAATCLNNAEKIRTRAGYKRPPICESQRAL